NQNCSRRDAGDQSGNDQDSAEEFSKRGKIGEPPGESETAHELHMMVKAAKYFGISVRDHNGAQHNAEHEQRQWLKSVEVGHIILRKNRVQHETKTGKLEEKYWIRLIGLELRSKSGRQPGTPP